ncbi:MAG: hypothetical protein AAF705_05985 [Bacteroidota bacterium]
MIKQIFSCLLAVLIFLGCNQQKEVESDRVYTVADVEVERTKDAVIYYSDSALTRVIITGPMLLNHTERNNQRKEFTEGIRVEFYDDFGAISSILTAKYAIQYEREDKVIVRDSVIWRSMEDQMLESSELIWDERDELVYTNKISVITTPTDTVFTQYFKAKQDFSEITMTSTDGAIIVEDLSKQ